MVVRRGRRRTATLLALGAGLAVALGGGLLVTAGAADAAEGRVDLRSAQSFKAGGGPQSASITVTRRERGCVQVRTGLAIGLKGMGADQVRVESFSGGGWRPIIVSPAGDSAVVTERTAPERANLCNRQSTTARYRITFGAEAPSGTVTIVGEAYDGQGQLIDRDTVTGRVNGVKTSPSPSKKSTKPSKKATPTATPTTESATVEPFDDPAKSPIALGVPNAPQDPGGGGFLGVSGLVMVGGLVLVGVGAALIFLLVRQIRADKVGGTAAEPAGGRHARDGLLPAPDAPTIFLPPVRPAGPGPDQPTVILPRIED